jgi:hypothetical protein
MSFIPRMIIRSKRPAAVASGSLSISAAAVAPLNMTSTFVEYWVQSGGNGVPTNKGSKIGAVLTGISPSVYGTTSGAGTANGQALNWTDATAGAAFPTGSNELTPGDTNGLYTGISQTSGTTESGVVFSIVAGTVTKTVRVFAYGYDFSGGNGSTVRATLLDGSAPSVNLRQGTISGAPHTWDIVFRAGSPAQQLKIEIFPDAISGTIVGFGAIGVF